MIFPWTVYNHLVLPKSILIISKIIKWTKHGVLQFLKTNIFDAYQLLNYYDFFQSGNFFITTRCFYCSISQYEIYFHISYVCHRKWGYMFSLSALYPSDNNLIHDSPLNELHFMILFFKDRVHNRFFLYHALYENIDIWKRRKIRKFFEKWNLSRCQQTTLLLMLQMEQPSQREVQRDRRIV